MCSPPYHLSSLTFLSILHHTKGSLRMLVSHHSKAVVAIAASALTPKVRAKVQHVAEPLWSLLEATEFPKLLHS